MTVLMTRELGRKALATRRRFAGEGADRSGAFCELLTAARDWQANADAGAPALEASA